MGVTRPPMFFMASMPMQVGQTVQVIIQSQVTYGSTQADSYPTSPKKQSTIALSSTEVEYMAATHVVQEGLWLESLFNKLHILFPTLIKTHLDNTGAITLLTATKFHGCSKHIDLHYHFVRHHINRKVFVFQWIPSHKNIADIFTKALPCPFFLSFYLHSDWQPVEGVCCVCILIITYQRTTVTHHTCHVYLQSHGSCALSSVLSPNDIG